MPLPSSAQTTTPAPTSVYGATKLAQENILSAWGGSRGVPITILRLQNVYGPGQSLINSYTGIVSLFSQWAREGKTIPLYEDGRIGRDFVYIEDVADAFVAAIEAGPDATRPTLDVGTGVAHTIEDMARAIAQYYGAPEPVVNGKYRDGDVRSASCDISLTLATLEWTPALGSRGGRCRPADLDRRVARPGGRACLRRGRSRSSRCCTATRHDDIERAALAAANSVSLARADGLITDWSLQLGDCSPEPVFPDGPSETMTAAVEGAGGSIAYTVFGANLGSAAGHNALAVSGTTELMLILNPDAQVAPDAVSTLARVVTDRVGIAEARQVPLEHPKDFAKYDR